MERKQGIQNNGLMHPETDGWGELHDLWAIEEHAREFHYSICETEACPLCEALEAHEKNNALYGQMMLVNAFINRIFGRFNSRLACLLSQEGALSVSDLPDTIGKLFHLDLSQQAELFVCTEKDLEEIAGKVRIQPDEFWFALALNLSDYVKERFKIGVD